MSVYTCKYLLLQFNFFANSGKAVVLLAFAKSNKPLVLMLFSQFFIKMHQSENYQDFLKWGGAGGGVLLGYSLIIIKWSWVFFSKNLQFDPLQLD